MGAGILATKVVRLEVDAVASWMVSSTNPASQPQEYPKGTSWAK